MNLILTDILSNILTESRSKQGRAAEVEETLQEYNIIYSCGLALLVHPHSAIERIRNRHASQGHMMALT